MVLVCLSAVSHWADTSQFIAHFKKTPSPQGCGIHCTAGRRRQWQGQLRSIASLMWCSREIPSLPPLPSSLHWEVNIWFLSPEGDSPTFSVIETTNFIPFLSQFPTLSFLTVSSTFCILGLRSSRSREIVKAPRS